nr:hypothetical protein [Pseudomonas fulva]
MRLIEGEQDGVPVHQRRPERFERDLHPTRLGMLGQRLVMHQASVPDARLVALGIGTGIGQQWQARPVFAEQVDGGCQLGQARLRVPWIRCRGRRKEGQRGRLDGADAYAALLDASQLLANLARVAGQLALSDFQSAPQPLAQ